MCQFEKLIYLPDCVFRNNCKWIISTILKMCVYIPHKREQSGDELKKMNVINGRKKRIQKKIFIKKTGE